MSEAKSKVAKTFDDWASWYDDRFGGWMRYSTRMALNEIKIPENPTCLDVACGTGISTFELMKICGNRGTFYGIDISRNMIDAANKMASEKGLGNAKFMYGDAERIEFPDDSFDLVLCNMSLHFFPDKPKALSEMCRVLKRGGQFAFTYAGKPAWQEIYKVAGAVLARHPDLPGLRKAVADTVDWPVSLEESIDLLEGAGLKISNIYERRAIDYSDPGFIVSESCSAWNYWRQETPAHVVDTIRGELLSGAREAASPRGFKHTSINIFAWGTKT
ncbi:MAG TPA: methyltransferase domain-containing protein [Candidatus Bathyarchaeia archaeon]